MTTFTVPGPPVPKARPRRAPAGHWYTPRETVEYEERVAWAAKAAGVQLKPGCWYKVSVVFYLLSYRRDRDNLVKSILDGLKRAGDQWDDSQVLDLVVYTLPVSKRADERAIVEVEVLDERPVTKMSGVRRTGH